MDTELYKEFISLVSHGSFVSAARDLNMSQPSLSRHMSLFANQLGCKLFYETRPLRLTAAGETVLKHASKIVGVEKTLLSELAEEWVQETTARWRAAAPLRLSDASSA